MYKYEKKGVLGIGSYGSAFLVTLRNDPSRKYVVKEVTVGHMKPADREKAQQEAELLQELHHSNIVRCVESFIEEEKLVIVMEYADGGDLGAAIERRRNQRRHFSEVEVMNIFCQLCLGLRHVHSHKILHRDLKTQNVFLTSSGIVKLGDFGIARRMDSSLDFAKTQIGTPYYISPEIWESRPYGKKTDVWSLGVILFEMLSLDVPFKANSLPALIQKIVSQPTGPLPSMYSHEMLFLATSLLQKDPAARPSVTQVLKSPYLQAYITMQISYTIKTGTGGAELEAAINQQAALQQRPQPYEQQPRGKASPPSDWPPGPALPQQPPSQQQPYADGRGVGSGGGRMGPTAVRRQSSRDSLDDSSQSGAVARYEPRQGQYGFNDFRREEAERQERLEREEMARREEAARREYFARQNAARANRLRAEGGIFGEQGGAGAPRAQQQPQQTVRSQQQQAGGADMDGGWQGQAQGYRDPSPPGHEVNDAVLRAKRERASAMRQQVEGELRRHSGGSARDLYGISPEERVSQMRQAGVLERQRALAKHEDDLARAHHEIALEKKRLYERMRQRKLEGERGSEGGASDLSPDSSTDYPRGQEPLVAEAKGNDPPNDPTAGYESRFPPPLRVTGSPDEGPRRLSGGNGNGNGNGSLSVSPPASLDAEGRKKGAAFVVDVKTGEMVEETERRGAGAGDASAAALQREERERNRREADDKRQAELAKARSEAFKARQELRLKMLKDEQTERLQKTQRQKGDGSPLATTSSALSDGDKPDADGDSAMDLSTSPPSVVRSVSAPTANGTGGGNGNGGRSRASSRESISSVNSGGSSKPEQQRPPRAHVLQPVKQLAKTTSASLAGSPPAATAAGKPAPQQPMASTTRNSLGRGREKDKDKEKVKEKEGAERSARRPSASPPTTQTVAAVAKSRSPEATLAPPPKPASGRASPSPQAKSGSPVNSGDGAKATDGPSSQGAGSGKEGLRREWELMQKRKARAASLKEALAKVASVGQVVTELQSKVIGGLQALPPSQEISERLIEAEHDVASLLEKAEKGSHKADSASSSPEPEGLGKQDAEVTELTKGLISALCMIEEEDDDDP